MPLLAAGCAAAAVAVAALYYPLDTSEFSVATAGMTADAVLKPNVPAASSLSVSPLSLPGANPVDAREVVPTTAAPAVPAADTSAGRVSAGHLTGRAQPLTVAVLQPAVTVTPAEPVVDVAPAPENAAGAASAVAVAAADAAVFAGGNDAGDPVVVTAPTGVTPLPAAVAADNGVELRATPPGWQPGWQETTVQPGDTLSGIFARLGATRDDMYALIGSSKEARALERLRPGQTIKLLMDGAGALMKLEYRSSLLSGLKAHRDDANGFVTEAFEHQSETETAFATGFVSNSLYQASREAGVSDSIIIAMANLFGGKIDFSHDVVPGDSFIIIYEKQSYRGEKVGDGAILAAEFVNRGKVHRAIGLRDDRGRFEYYSPDGRSLKLAFMRNPIAINRITSHFQPNRLHPVTGKRRPHRGVDYGAPTGTPIQASGDGKVAFIGRKGGYGKTVILKHGRRYTTLYAHMSRFKKGLRVGSPVSQGDVIGYVGTTGVSTGPHLHYEFRIDGEHQNPVTVNLPGRTLDTSRRAEFDRIAGHYNALLDKHKSVLLAAK